MSARAFTLADDQEIAERFRNGATQAVLSRTFGGSRVAVVNSLKRSGAYEQRPGGKPDTRRRVWSEAEIEALLELWASGHSKTELSRQLHTHSGVIDRLLAEQGVDPYDRPYFKGKLGDDHPRWKGGRHFVQVDGVDTYVRVRVNDSPRLPS